MLQHIMVPLDDSPESEGAIKLAERLLGPGKSGALTLLRAIPTHRGPGRERAFSATRAELEATADRVLGQRRRWRTVATRVEEGDPAEVILACARDSFPDLIAMSTHGRQGLGRLVKGSVAEAVLRECPTPLLLGNLHGIRMAGSESPFHKILVPLDGSDVSHRVLKLVEVVAPMFKAEVILLRVEDREPKQGTRRFEDLEGYLGVFASHLQDAGVAEVRCNLSYGDPAETILGLIPELRVDLVAMSTSGRSGLERLRFGSVAESVLRECPTPLLIYGGGVDEPE